MQNTDGQTGSVFVDAAVIGMCPLRNTGQVLEGDAGNGINVSKTNCIFGQNIPILFSVDLNL